MIVVDASVTVPGLLDDGDARQALATESMAVPDLADSEVAQESHAREALRRWAIPSAPSYDWRRGYRGRFGQRGVLRTESRQA